MSSGATTVMEYKFTGDTSSAVAALQELRARLADVNRDSMKYAKEVAKGNEEQRKGLLESVKASDQLKGKMRELTNEVQKFQNAGGVGGKGMFFMPSLTQLQGALTGAAFGLDDFIQQYGATGKLSDGIRAAGNNLTMLASLFGPVAVVATAMATAVGGFWARTVEKSDTAIKNAEEYKKRLEELQKAEERGRGVTEDQKKVSDAQATVWAAEAKVKEAEVKHGGLGGQSALGIALFGRGETTAEMKKTAALNEEVIKAKEDARIAKEGLAQTHKEVTTKQMETQLGKGKDDLARLYQEARAGGATPEAAQAAVMAKAKNLVGPEQQIGLRGMIEGISKKEEGDLTGKAAARGLEDPNVAKKREAETKAAQMEFALHQKEAAAETERVGMGRKNITRTAKEDIAADKQSLQEQRDVIKRLDMLIEEQKRTREEKLSQAVVPKGLGVAGR